MNKFLVVDDTKSNINSLTSSLNNLSDEAFFLDGSKTMTGNIELGNNSLAGGINIVLENQGSASNPPAGQLKLFSKTDKKIYIRDNLGVETDLTSGGGDVFADGTSTANALVRYTDATGKLIKNSGAVLSDAGSLSGISQISGDIQITGDLVVQGTTVTTEAENVLISANYLNNNSNYTTVAAQTGGLTVRYLPTSTNSTSNGNFTAGVASVSNPQVITTDSGTFSAGNIIAIDNANDSSNNGLFEVSSHSGTTLIIRGIGTIGPIEDFTNNQFITDTDLGATIRQVNVSVIRAASSGDWEVSKGNNTTLTYSQLGNVSSDASSVQDNLAIYSDNTGKSISDSLISKSNVVQSNNNFTLNKLIRSSGIIKNIKDSVVTLDNSGVISGLTGVTSSGVIDFNSSTSFDLGTTSDTANAINIESSGGTTASQRILNNTGDTLDSILIKSTAGGIQLDSSSGVNVASGGLNITNEIKIQGGSPGIDKVLTSDAVGVGSWETPTLGTVVGPGSSTANRITLFGDGTGELIKQSTEFSIDESDTDKLIFKHGNDDCMVPAMKYNNCFYGISTGELLPGNDLAVQNNTIIGPGCFTVAASGSIINNTVLGNFSLNVLEEGIRNTCVGSLSCRNLTVGEDNTSVGMCSLENLTTGSGNTCIGDNSGIAYTGSESGNVLIGRGVIGTLGESNVIRIGNIQNNTIIKGITNKNALSVWNPVRVSATGELGINQYGYASYYFGSNAFATNGTQNVYMVISGTRFANLSTSNFTVDTATPDIEYIGVENVVCRVTVSANWSNEDASNNFCRIGVHKNGTLQNSLEQRANLSSGNDYPRNVSLDGFIGMGTNDKIDVRVLNEESSFDDILVSYFTLNIQII